MPSSSGHRDYDANLLASAPVATKAQLQSGYNPELLAEKTTPPSSKPDLEARGSSPVKRTEYVPPILPKAKAPFYRTRKGIIIVVVVLVVIIAAAVGGGVAASKAKNKHATGASQGGAPHVTMTPGASTTTGPQQTTIGPSSATGQSTNNPTPVTITGQPISGGGSLPSLTQTLLPAGTSSSSTPVQIPQGQVAATER